MLSQTDVDWIQAQVTGLGYDAHDQTVIGTPPREYVVIYPGETTSPLERAGGVQVRERQAWRLMCVSRSLPVLRRMTAAICARFTGARFGTGALPPVIVEDQIGPELEQGNDADRRYSQTLVYSHHQPRRNQP
ncbi:MAG: hypothetical protein KIT69_06010 [Propionibacteriaceae bacterium]|nr:hypothetical protein [Propionibacteriaceae bacterium]